MPIISVFQRLRQEGHKFQASLVYMMRPVSKIKQNKIFRRKDLRGTPPHLHLLKGFRVCEEACNLELIEKA
jgi:hypothetical protein